MAVDDRAGLEDRPIRRTAGRAAEAAAMRRAVELAGRGVGLTSPNPVVGCVILDAAGDPVGEGFHEYAGGPHAEIHALEAAAERARGGTAVITLEPCAHSGRTPPCTRALLDAGVRRVVAAVADPHPTAGGGAQALRTAGIDVELGLLEAEARLVNEAWLTATTLGRPHVTWKFAASLDGRVAAADGTSRWITSELARADVHRLRAQVDAVVVGSGTLHADDPHLAARVAGVRKQPLRVLVDSNARISPGARALDRAAPTLIAVGEGADIRRLGPETDVVELPRVDRGIDLDKLLAALRDRGVVSVLLEGGPTLAAAFLEAGLIDKVIGYIAPALVGDGGLPLVPGVDAPSIADVARFRLEDVRQIGSDVRITARADQGARGRMTPAGRPQAL